MVLLNGNAQSNDTLLIGSKQTGYISLVTSKIAFLSKTSQKARHNIYKSNANSVLEMMLKAWNPLDETIQAFCQSKKITNSPISKNPMNQWVVDDEDLACDFLD